MTRFILKKSKTRPLWWVLCDMENEIVCQFQEGRFNDTQHYTPLRDDAEYDMEKLPAIARDSAEWLRANHYELLFDSPREIADNARRHIGKQSRRARESREMNVDTLAWLTGYSANTVERIEAGKFKLDIDTLAQLCNALGIRLHLY